MNNNNFFKHFMIIGSGTLINMILGLLTTPIITRMVSPIEYGKLSIFTMYSSIAVMILCLGLDQALVRYYYEKEDVNYKRSLLFKCIKFPVILTIATMLFVIITSHFKIINYEFEPYIMVILCIYILVQLLYRFSILIVRLEYKSKLYSTLNIILKISYILIVIPLILIVKKDYLYLLTISTLISASICFAISIMAQLDIWNIFKNKSNNCTISQKELIKYAYPYIISMSITTLFQAIDKISLNYYCSYQEVGIYSSTMSLVHIFAIVQSTFNTLWAPMSIEHYTKDKNDRTFYQKGNQIITVIMFFIGLTLILVKDIFAILLGEKYREAAYILPFLIFNPIMYTISETTVCGLVFKKKSKMQVIVAIGACITNIIGNTLLVPILGCKGAAISTGISYIVFFILRTILSNRYFYIEFKLKKFTILTSVTVLYAAYNTFIKFNITSIILYIVCLITLIILYKDTILWLIDYSKNIIYKNILKKYK